MGFYVKLESKRGHVYLTDRNAAFESDTIRNLVVHSKQENPTVSLPTLSMKALLKIVVWCEMHSMRKCNLKEEIESEPEEEFIAKWLRPSQWEMNFFQGLSKKLLQQLCDGARLLEICSLESALGKFLKYIIRKRKHEKIAELAQEQAAKSQPDQCENVPEKQEDETVNQIVIQSIESLLNESNTVDNDGTPLKEEKCPTPEKKDIEKLRGERKEQIVSLDEIDIFVNKENTDEASFLTLLASFIKESIICDDQFNDSIWKPAKHEFIEQTEAQVRSQTETSPKVAATYEKSALLHETVVPDESEQESQIQCEILLQQDKEFSNMQMDDKTWSEMNNSIIRTRKWGSSKVKAFPIELTNMDLYAAGKTRNLCPTPVQVLSNDDCHKSICPTTKVNFKTAMQKQVTKPKSLRLYERGNRSATRSSDAASNEIRKLMENCQTLVDGISTDGSVVEVKREKTREWVEKCQASADDASTNGYFGAVASDCIDELQTPADEYIGAVNRESILEWVIRCQAENKDADEAYMFNPFGDEIDEMSERMYHSDGLEYMPGIEADMEFTPDYYYNLENIMCQTNLSTMNPPPGFYPRSDFTSDTYEDTYNGYAMYTSPDSSPTLLTDSSHSAPLALPTSSPEFLQSLIEFHMENDGFYQPEYLYPEFKHNSAYEQFIAESYPSLYDLYTSHPLEPYEPQKMHRTLNFGSM